MWSGVEEREGRWEERREVVLGRYARLRESMPELPPRLRPFQVYSLSCFYTKGILTWKFFHY